MHILTYDCKSFNLDKMFFYIKYINMILIKVTKIPDLLRNLLLNVNIFDIYIKRHEGEILFITQYHSKLIHGAM